MHRYEENVKQNTRTPQAACYLFGKQNQDINEMLNVKKIRAWVKKALLDNSKLSEVFIMISRKLNFWEICESYVIFSFFNRTKSINRLNK